MKLSVLMVTYNHEKYIAQALDSALMQEVDFDYEIVIGEDCSTDNTRSIVIEYQNKFPDKIRLILHDENLGGTRNFAETYKSCRGQYIAILEGDDYWSSPHKLQKQVNCLDTHINFSMSFHNVDVIYEDSSAKSHALYDGMRNIYTIADVLSGNFIISCSVIFRNNLFSTFPDCYHEITMGDWLLFIMISERGSIYYINEVLGCYRKHSSGCWSSETALNKNQKCIYAAEQINNYLNNKYSRRINKYIAELYYNLANIYNSANKSKEAISYALKSLVAGPFNPKISKKRIAGIILKQLSASVYNLIHKHI